MNKNKLSKKDKQIKILLEKLEEQEKEINKLKDLITVIFLTRGKIFDEQKTGTA